MRTDLFSTRRKLAMKSRMDHCLCASGHRDCLRCGGIFILGGSSVEVLEPAALRDMVDEHRRTFNALS